MNNLEFSLSSVRGNKKREAQYGDKKKDLDDYQEKIKNTIESEAEISETDKIRLTRVLQLLQKYTPSREVSGRESQLFTILKDLYRFIPKRKTNTTEERSNPYLLAEETVSALRSLRHLDYDIKKNIGEVLANNDFLKQEMSEEIISSDILDTSLTLEYEKKNWGLDRICLDGIQNHLISDSGGSCVFAQCLINQEWVSLAEAKSQANKIKAVRFVDDGVGYDVKNLVLFWSTKSQETGSRGQFGEGMKMVAAASLRENLDMELQSQNWSARPFAKKIEVDNTRKKAKEEVEQLAFKINHHKQEDIIGSRTIFHKPSSKFINEVLKLDDKVLELDSNYKPLFVGNLGQIVSSKEREIFVKGIFVKNESTLFSYNFDDIETNRDRNAIVQRIDNRVSSIIQELNDKRLIKTLLQKSIDTPETLESQYYQSTDYPSLWREAFYEAFGKDACINTNFETPEALKSTKARKITLPEVFARLLIKEAGVKTDKEVIPEFYQETISTSVTLEYGKEIWEEERIMLDAIQNHLPQDAEGGNVYLRFKDKEGAWHSFKDLDQYENDDIELIKIANSGSRGYDHRLLGIFESMKNHDKSSGKWGEGLKMLSAACLRKGIDMNLKSRKWRATPQVVNQEIDGRDISQLVFKVTHEVRDAAVDDGDSNSYYEQSSTTFNKPNEKLIEEFRKAPQKVLSIENKRPLNDGRYGQILQLRGGELFVRGILIPGKHDLHYSYHFPDFDIKTRDRNAISGLDLQVELARIWSDVENPEIIKDFLYQATLAVNNNDGRQAIEFDTNFYPQHDDKWLKAYREIFGEDTAVRSNSSQDFNAMHQLEHVGLKMVSMPDAVYKMLINLRGKNNEKIPNYRDKIKSITDVVKVENEKLTESEKQIIDLLYRLDEFLPGNRRHDIEIYTRKYSGQDVASGYTDGNSVKLLRDILSDLILAVDVYYHEKTHAITGAEDAEAGFRNFLTRALAILALKQVEKE